MEAIRVKVVNYPDRANLVMRYLCPESGKQIARSTGTRNQREAERTAAKWEADLREGRYNKPAKMAWQEFRERYDVDVLDAMKATTATNYSASLNVYERAMKPRRLAEVTTTNITSFVTTLRRQSLSPATIARHLRQLKVALRWAHRQGLLITLPKFDRIKQSKGSRGRAVSGEEFDRMLAAVPKVVGEAAADSWTFYLRGLDSSGLRLSESLVLRWDDGPDAIVVDYSGRHPMLRIDASAEKANTHRLLPMSPEFSRLLDEVPVERRHGRVFQPLDRNALPYSPTRDSIGPIVSAIGAKAGIIVGERTKLDDEGKPVTVPKFASAHDLRRAFGFRWSRRVMPPVLKELMRHTDIATTMKYYVGVNAQATASELWRVDGNISGNRVAKEDVATTHELT
jgi:integrase